VSGRLVEAALREAVADEVLRRRRDPVFEMRPLEAADISATERGGEIRVLAVCLLDAPPARVARDVEDRRERHARSDYLHPAPDRRRDCLDQFDVEGRGRPDRLLERRGTTSEKAVERFLVEDRRDAEPRLLDQEALDRVPGLRRIRGIEVGRPGDPADLADPVGQALPHAVRVELGLAPEQLERPE
jgi:hypothetical protein